MALVLITIKCLVNVVQHLDSVELMKVTVIMILNAVVTCAVAKIIVQHPFHLTQTAVLTVPSFLLHDLESLECIHSKQIIII